MDQLTTKGMPKETVNRMRKTGNYTNVCFNPLQAIRAWGLLTNIADNKTLDDLASFIGKYGISRGNMKSLNDGLLALHVAAEENFDGCVRLFTELPHHLKHNSDVRHVANMYYGGRSRRAAIQHHSFATDSDGFYSCHRINQEIMLSTHGAVRYIVPESHAPNWRASIVLASAMDCPFFWEVKGPAKQGKIHFKCSKYGPSSCTGHSALSNVWQDKELPIVRLPSFIYGVDLYMYRELDDAIDDSRSLDSVVLERIADETKWTARTCTVVVPQATCSTPISMFRHSKAKGLQRVYCSEKAELQEMTANSFHGHANFVTLFDHYHKTTFEILPTTPTKIGKVADSGIEKSHQFVDGQQADRFTGYQREPEHNPILAYYEDHLDQSTSCMMPFNPQDEYLKVTETDLVFDKPFYFLMTRKIMGTPVVVCAGYFNNTILVNRE